MSERQHEQVDESLLALPRGADMRVNQEHSEKLVNKEFFLQMPAEFDNRKLCVHEYGDPNGPIIISLHGWGANGRALENVHMNLEGYHIYAPDFPAFGQSEALESKNTTFDKYADLVEWLAHTMAEGKKIHAIMGISMGSVIATKLVVERYREIQRNSIESGIETPDPITKKLVLIGATINGVQDGRILGNEVMGDIMGAVFETMPKLPDGVKKVTNVLNSVDMINPALIDKQYLDRDIGTSKEATLLAEQLSHVDLKGLDYTGFQVGYFHGQNDRYTKPNDIVNHANEIGAEPHIYSKSGHDVHFDAADMGIAEDMQRFLDS